MVLDSKMGNGFPKRSKRKEVESLTRFRAIISSINFGVSDMHMDT